MGVLNIIGNNYLSDLNFGSLFSLLTKNFQKTFESFQKPLDKFRKLMYNEHVIKNTRP